MIQIIEILINYTLSKPMQASGATIGTSIIGNLLLIVPTGFDKFIDFVIPCLQTLAFIISIAVGIATLYGMHKKWKREKQSKIHKKDETHS